MLWSRSQARWTIAALFAFTLALAPITLSVAHGQEVVIKGYVTDAGGVPIAGASVTFRDLASGAVEQRVTHDNGGYDGLVFAIGTRIEVTAELEGFVFPESPRTLVVGGDALIDFRAAGGTIEVSGLVLRDFVYPDGRTNRIAFSEPVAITVRNLTTGEESSLSSDETGSFGAFRVVAGMPYEVVPAKDGYRFEPASLLLDDSPRQLLEFVAVPDADRAPAAAGLDLVATERLPALEVATPAPPAEARPAAPRAESGAVVTLDEGALRAELDVQVFQRVRRRDGSLAEVALDGVQLRFRNLATGRTGARTAADGVAPTYYSQIGAEFEVTPVRDGFRFDRPAYRVKLDQASVLLNIVGEAVAVAASPPPPDPRLQFADVPIDRVQLCIDTDGRVEAGTDADVWVTLNDGERHYIDEPGDDFERNDHQRCYDVPFEVVKPQLRTAGDLQTLTLGMEGDDDWCVAKLRLFVNNNLMTDIDRPDTGCWWFGDDYPSRPTFSRVFPIRFSDEEIGLGMGAQRRFYQDGEERAISTAQIEARVLARVGHQLAIHDSIDWGDGFVRVRAQPQNRYSAQVWFAKPEDSLGLDSPPEEVVDITYAVIRNANGTYLTQVDAVGGDGDARRRLARGEMSLIKIGGRPYESMRIDGDGTLRLRFPPAR